MEIQWPLVIYTLLTGLGLGAFSLAAISEWLRKGERTRLPVALTALLAMVVGDLASVFHLGHPERIFNAMATLGSGVTLEMYLTGLTVLAALVYVVMLWRGAPDNNRRIVGTLGLVCAVALVFVMGSTYVLPARPAWNTLLLPLLFFTSAALLGFFTVYFWAAFRKEDAGLVALIRQGTLITLAVQAVVLIAYLAYLSQAREASPAPLLSGGLSLVFWIGIVLIGLVIPAGALLWARTTTQRVGLMLATALVGLVCVLAGSIAVRAALYVLGGRVASF